MQSNQFLHAVDLARQFRAAGIQCAVGGCHISDCLAMLDDVPPDIQETMDMGISTFAGEAEEHLDEVLIDADRGELKPVFNYYAQV